MFVTFRLWEPWMLAICYKAIIIMIIIIIIIIIIMIITTTIIKYLKQNNVE